MRGDRSKPIVGLLAPLLLATAAGALATLFASSLFDAETDRALVTNRSTQIENAVQDNPEDPTAWKLLGLQQTKEAQRTDSMPGYIEAEQSLVNARDIGGDDPDVLLALAQINLGLHRFDQAHVLAVAARELQPNDPSGLATLFDSQIELGFYSEAETTIEHLIATSPDLASYSRLSYYRQINGDTDGALKAMLQAKTAAKGLPEDEARIDGLVGELHSKRGELAEALSAYSSAAKGAPDRSSIVLGRAEALALNNDLNAAVAIVDEQINDDAPASVFMLAAELYDKAGRKEDAADAIETVTEIARKC